MIIDLQNTLQKALDATVDMLASYFVYKGATYKAVINDMELYTELAEGGLKETLATVIVVSKTQLKAKPVTGETVTISGKPARIYKVADDELAYTLTCITATK